MLQAIQRAPEPGARRSGDFALDTNCSRFLDVIHAPPARRRWARIGADRRCGVALEFALICVPFMMLLLMVVELGYDFFAQEALDFALAGAARQVQLGTAQGASTVAIFQSSYFCPALVGLLSCSAVSVNVQAVASDYYAQTYTPIPLNKSGQLNTSGFSFCSGQPNQLMFAQAVYTGPSVVAGFIPGMGTPTTGGTAHITVSTTAFINENFPVTASPQAGC